MLPDRPTIMRVALEAQLDPRTVKRALEHGLESLKSDFDRARLKDAAAKFGVKLRA